MHFSRRGFLGAGAAGLLLPRTALGQAAPPPFTFLPSPVFPSPDETRFETRAGDRPYRAGGYRLEVETIGQQYVIHNYGHGGGGISMSWGCAEEVLRLAVAHRTSMSDMNIAVLGGGVMGMTAATLLKRAGFAVTIHASLFTPNTTSDVAGGQWAPSLCGDNQAEIMRRARPLLRASYAHHLAAGSLYGVSERDNYTHQPSTELAEAQLAGAAPRERMARLPFRRMSSGGWRYPTLLVEPPIMLRRLHTDLRAAGVPFVRRSFAGPASVAGLSQSVVVNCLGLGSRDVWADPTLSGKRGVLAFLPPQPNLRYLYSGIGYLFPRQDRLVIGGSIEDEDSVDARLTDQDKAKLMVKVVRAVFQGAVPVPDWLSGSSRITGADMLRSTEGR